MDGGAHVTTCKKATNSSKIKLQASSLSLNKPRLNKCFILQN